MKQLRLNTGLSNPQFFKPPDNSKQKSFPSPQSNTVILVTTYPWFLGLSDFSNQFFRFPLRIEKSPRGFNCNFGMIISTLDVKIGRVFVFTAIWVHLYNTCFRALCNFFSDNKVTAPQVQRCPYAHVDIYHCFVAILWVIWPVMWISNQVKMLGPGSST